MRTITYQLVLCLLLMTVVLTGKSQNDISPHEAYYSWPEVNRQKDLEKPHPMLLTATIDTHPGIVLPGSTKADKNKRRYINTTHRFSVSLRLRMAYTYKKKMSSYLKNAGFGETEYYWFIFYGGASISHPDFYEPVFSLVAEAQYQLDKGFSISASFTTTEHFAVNGYNGYIGYSIISRFTRYNLLLNYALAAPYGYSLKIGMGPTLLNHKLILLEGKAFFWSKNNVFLYESIKNRLGIDISMSGQYIFGLKERIYTSLNLTATIAGKYKLPEITMENKYIPVRVTIPPDNIPIYNLGISIGVGYYLF